MAEKSEDIPIPVKIKMQGNCQNKKNTTSGSWWENDIFVTKTCKPGDFYSFYSCFIIIILIVLLSCIFPSYRSLHNIQLSHPLQVHEHSSTSGLQIRGGLKNIKIYFFSFLKENICCDPSLEPSRGDGSNDGSQNMFLWRHMSNYSGLNYPC